MFERRLGVALLALTLLAKQRSEADRSLHQVTAPHPKR